MSVPTLQDHPTDTAWLEVDRPRPARPPVRRLRGLALPVLPSWPLVAQAAGAVATMVGVWQEWGSPAALMASGVAAVLTGMLRESGRI